ncbi:MAG: acyl-CoA thioesterase [Lachnospiraceae bacterium]|nr:acyl-CoA thioesterase [Lachnospiraceae bacterium]
MEFEQYRTVEFSKTEWVKCIQYEDINGAGRLYGGRLMEWMDQVAGIAATRHCAGHVTTAACDDLQFKNAAYINDIVVVIAKVTYVGYSSMEVRTDVYVEERETGLRRVINRAYFTEVHVDEKGRPKKVRFGLDLQSESDKAEYEGALRRREMRKIRRAEGF